MEMAPGFLAMDRSFFKGRGDGAWKTRCCSRRHDQHCAPEDERCSYRWAGTRIMSVLHGRKALRVVEVGVPDREPFHPRVLLTCQEKKSCKGSVRGVTGPPGGLRVSMQRQLPGGVGGGGGVLSC